MSIRLKFYTDHIKDPGYLNPGWDDPCWDEYISYGK